MTVRCDKVACSMIESGLFLIFGDSGSGKTTLGEIFETHGFRCIDTDAELAQHVDRVTGELLSREEAQIFMRRDSLMRRDSQEFHKKHAFVWPEASFNEIIASEERRPLFFAGQTYQLEKFLPRFQRAYALMLGAEERAQRLMKRDPKRYRKNSPKLKRIRLRGRWVKPEHLAFPNVVQIDARKSSEDIFNEIIKDLGLEPSKNVG